MHPASKHRREPMPRRGITQRRSAGASLRRGSIDTCAHRRELARARADSRGRARSLRPCLRTLHTRSLCRRSWPESSARNTDNLGPRAALDPSPPLCPRPCVPPGERGAEREEQRRLCRDQWLGHGLDHVKQRSKLCWCVVNSGYASVMAKPKASTAAAAKKPRVRDRSGALYVLLDPAQLEALDAWADRLNEGNVGPQWNRTALVRALVARALGEKAAKGEAP